MIELKNITYKVNENGQEKIILDGVSCVFNDNTVTAITGHNGSGKSTLTKIIMGILKPTSGSVFFNGEDITNKTISERANLGINYAFQIPTTFTGVTIKELIDFATKENNSIPKACEYLSKVGICAKEYISRQFDKTLSGGELKRIELALALAKKGSTYIFDEPEAGIDMWSFDRLKELIPQNSCTIIVSHQERLLKDVNKLIVMENGKIKDSGSASNVLKKQKSLSCTKLGGKNVR